MNVGDLVKISKDPKLLDYAGLECLMEDPTIFDEIFTLQATWNDGWWDISSESGRGQGYAFPEGLLIKQI